MKVTLNTSTLVNTIPNSLTTFSNVKKKQNLFYKNIFKFPIGILNNKLINYTNL